MSGVFIAGHPVVGGEVWIRAGESLIVSGSDVRDVRTEAGVPFAPGPKGAFEPTRGLAEAFRKTTATLALVVTTATGEVCIRVHNAGRLLTRDEVDALRHDLGHMALSLARGLMTAAARTSEGGTGDPERRGLYGTLEWALPRLLDRPIRVRAFRAGAVDVTRARQQAALVRQRIAEPHRRHVLGFAQFDEPPLGDYAWLRWVVSGLATYAYITTQCHADIRDRGGSDPLPTGADWWADRLSQLDAWMSHDELRAAAGTPVKTPSWNLTRSVEGGAILSASQASGIAGLAHQSTRRSDVAVLASDDYLYEIWVLFALVMVLLQNYGFTVEPSVHGAAFLDHAYEKSPGKWSFHPITLRWRGIGGDGEAIDLDATIEHGPTLKTKDGGVVTPDVVLTIRGGEDGYRRQTVHMLDAKLKRHPRRHARITARDWYLNRIEPRPTAVFTVHPAGEAFLPSLMRERRTEAKDGDEDGTAAKGAHEVYGFAWGSLQARPRHGAFDGQDPHRTGLLGIRQFAALCLQYHRSELRFICAQCGRHAAEVSDVPAAARRDERRRSGRLLNSSLVIYRCDCGHVWRRQVCWRGHLLMKHGQLTPHERVHAKRPDKDHDLFCAVCGAARRDAPAHRPPRLPRR